MAFESATSRSNSAMLASRAGADSGLNGDSGLRGSAAFLKNCAANSWCGAATSSQACSTPSSRWSNRLSRSSTCSAAAACSSWSWS